MVSSNRKLLTWNDNVKHFVISHVLRQGALNPKNRFLGQKVWFVAPHTQSDRQAHWHGSEYWHVTLRILTVFTLLLIYLLGRSLMICCRKNSWNPERVPSVHVVTFVCVCLSVCPSVRNQAPVHIFWPRNLIFGLSVPWDMRKKHIFCFSKLVFLRFL